MDVIQQLISKLDSKRIDGVTISAIDLVARGAMAGHVLVSWGVRPTER